MVSRTDFVLRPPIGTLPTPTRPIIGPGGTGGPVRPRDLLPAPKPQITLPKGLTRPPTTNDLVIKRTFDGLTPKQAERKIAGALTGPVAAQNRKLFDSTVQQRVRDMQVALNNVFTPGTPHHQFLASQQPAKINVIGSMSDTNAIVYQVTKEGQPPKYYARGWGSGAFTELKQPPVQQVMNAEVTLEPRGLRMQYPAWTNKALAGTISAL